MRSTDRAPERSAHGLARVFPDGASPVTRLRGASQVEAMRDLEARLQGVAASWPEAAGEQAAIAEHRSRYEAAVQARSASERQIRDLRAARDAARHAFLDLFSEVASRIKAVFPRNRAMQDLFFDAVRTRSTARDSEVPADDELDDIIEDADDISEEADDAADDIDDAADDAAGDDPDESAA